MLLLEASSLPNKGKIIEKMTTAPDEAQQQQQMLQNQRNEAIFAAELENKQADTSQKRSTAIKNVADAQAKIMQAQPVMPPATGEFIG